MRKALLLVLLAACGVTDMPRQTVIRPTGVITQPNEEGELPPGSLSVGNNIRIRRQGVIEPRPAFKTRQNLGLSDNDIRKIWELNNNLTLTVRVDQSSGVESLYFQNGTQDNKINYGLSTNFAFTPGKTHLTKARDRWIITNDNAPAVLDPESFSGPFTARKAGLPQPGMIYGQWTGGTSGTAVAMSKWTAVCAVFKRTKANGYVIRSAPSHVFLDENSNGGTRNLLYDVVWNQDTWGLEAGDEVEFYRALSGDTAAEVTDDFRLSTTYTITSADLTASFLQAVDTTPDANLGAYLYSNGTQEGASKVNLMPPVSTDVVTFKGATFYNAPTAWQALTFNATGKVGILSTAADRLSGVGQRAVSGTITTASDEITGVSDADIVGIEVGQVVTGSAVFPTGTAITALTDAGATWTITVSEPATGNATSVNFNDVLVIDGNTIDYGGMGDVLTGLSFLYTSGDSSVVLSTGRVDWGLAAEAVPFALINPLPEGAAFTVKGTNGQNFVPALPALDETALSSSNDPRTNRLYFSKIDQPEAVPPDNFLRVGQGTILKLWATQETLFVFCTDGIFRIDGDGDDWVVRPFDPDTILLAPDAVDSLDNQIFAFTSAGFVAVSDSGVQKISNPLIGEDIRELEAEFASRLPYSWNVQVAADKHRSEVWFNFCDYEDDETDVLTWIWNTDTHTFVTQTSEGAIAVTYSPSRKSLLAGSRVGGVAVALRVYADDQFMVPEIVFNPVHADDLGNLKQWIDVTLFLEDLTTDIQLRPKFSGESYSGFYTLSATSGSFEHVIAPVLNAVHSKHCEFGLAFDPSGETLPDFRLMGLSYRFRLSSDTLRA